METPPELPQPLPPLPPEPSDSQPMQSVKDILAERQQTAAQTNIEQRNRRIYRQAVRNGVVVGLIFMLICGVIIIIQTTR